MSIRTVKTVAEVLFKEEPIMACRFKEVICELLDKGFHDETIWDLYQAFFPVWLEHTGHKN